MTEPVVVKRRVLIVDGDPAFGGSLQADFLARGFEVDTIATAAEALASVAAAPPDLVLLDLYLPDGAALDLIRRWKTAAPAMIVILVSGNASLTVVVNALKEGARRFFTKPVTAAMILDELERRHSTQHQLGASAMQAEGVDRFFAISPGLMSVAGFDGYFKMLNPAWEKTLGYSVDELCATPYLELVHPDDRDKATDEALELCGSATVFRYKNRYRCKDGTYRWLAWSATPSPAQQLIYGSARDVTKSVRLEHGLRESNERLKAIVASRGRLLEESAVKHDSLVELARHRDEVAAMIVHDLKNPLSVIVGNYDYILEAFEGSADCLEALQDSQNAGRRMLRLLANLVDVARLETGTAGATAPAVISVPRLLRPIVDQRRVLARQRDIEIVLLDAPELAVEVDVDLMTRVIENIFDNALRYTPVSGRIEIELLDRGADVEIRIGNTGRPIPAEERHWIFDKFRQSSGDPSSMNLGLGLHFCRLAVQAQRGVISVEQTERLPAVFVIRLPRASLAASTQDGHGSQAAAMNIA